MYNYGTDRCWFEAAFAGTTGRPTVQPLVVCAFSDAFYAIIFLATAMTDLHFKPIEIPNQEPRPDFWKVRPQEIVDLCERTSRCSRKEILARTPLGHPVYALFYGDFNDAPPQTNWSAGSSSTTWRNYMGDPPPAKQTFLLLAGIHGAEAESVAAAVNLVQCLETGADFRGKAHDGLVNLISRYRFIVVPCVNMDGRFLSPDHLRQADWQTFRAASQGVWKDGSPIGWRGSKSWFPLPLEKVAFPGGYPNGDGYNIMHDATPGDVRTAEARGLLRLAARWRVDAVLNAHSCEYASSVLAPSAVDVPANAARANAIADRANAAIAAAGLNPRPPLRGRSLSTRIDLNTLLSLASGALALTLECTVSYDRPLKPGAPEPTRLYTFDELMEPVFLSLHAYLADGLERPFLHRCNDGILSD